MIGLIFGENNFPKEILKKIKKIKKKYLIIDLTKNKNFKKEKYSYSISIGQIGLIINTLKENNCKTLLFAGKVDKPIFSKLKLDLKGIYYMPGIIKASKIGDAAILKEVIKIFKTVKINTISSLTFTPELCFKKSVLTKIKPNKEDYIDIKKAILTLNKLNGYSCSQGTIVKNNKVIAIEGNEGTQKMLQKIKTREKKLKGVLVKYPKKKQDLRVDLPTIGLKTIIQCKKAGLKGIAIKNKLNVCLDKTQLINFANKNKMFITCI
jgi:DUF1009 family protein